ncbi:DEAD/DEAH box helicase [Streptomyces sp. NPDC088197]|uniref:DEAD/DEAH box helicase n=1 Tax=Streptomyces sp. NPDC088197 TaxID=3365840 RepID=UPI0038034A9B
MSDIETFAPRPYQAEAIQSVLTGWAEQKNRLAVVLPTGAGKTVVFANLIAARDAAGELPGRVLVIAHREELIQQAADKIRAVVPGRTVGIVKAGRDETYADVIVASVQTLAVERRRRRIDSVGMIIVDECHHAAAQTYRDVLRHFGAWDGVPTVGFTATLTRTDGGLADIWTEVVYRMDTLDLIEAGHLVDVVGKRVVVDGLDLDRVKTAAGDLVGGQLGQALEDSNAAAVVAEAYRTLAADRPGVVFTPTVNSARVMAEVMTQAGIATGVVYGDMPVEDRRAALARYKAGDLQVLANCMLLTEGFDAPHTSCAVIARPTKSPGLYVQMAGRALRLHPGKTDALILDVVGASTRHKLASLVDLSERSIPAPRDGQSLTAAARGPVEVVAPTVQPVLRVEDIEMFTASRVRWLRTRRGTWFIPAGDVLLYLVADHVAGGYRLRKWEGGAEQAPPRDEAFHLEEAMHWMEMHARRVARGTLLLTRTAGWRNAQPSSRQLGYCRRYRIPILPGATAGDVSDAMDVHRASATLDRVLVGAA